MSFSITRSSRGISLRLDDTEVIARANATIVSHETKSLELYINNPNTTVSVNPLFVENRSRSNEIAGFITTLTTHYNNTLQREQFVIDRESTSWKISLSATILTSGKSLFDALALAVYVALTSISLPQAEYLPTFKWYKVISTQKPVPLCVTKVLIPVTHDEVTVLNFIENGAVYDQTIIATQFSRKAELSPKEAIERLILANAQ